jgi:DNA topoisomerase-1
LAATVAAVAKRLGNTPTICRKCYIHPEVLTAYADGRLARLNGTPPAAALRGLLRRQSMVAALSASLKLVGARPPHKQTGRKIPTV